MLFTCKRTPPYAGVKTCLQIFSIRVMEISDGHLEWPLEVYGLVAIRDSVDHNRNMIFRRKREACQLLNQQVCCGQVQYYFNLCGVDYIILCPYLFMQLIDLLTSSATNACCRIHS